ncbi:MAG: radical SAM protein, partial [Clostridiales bacterium]|nr:radical SAM protein [Clostridiales bacterium]
MAVKALSEKEQARRDSLKDKKPLVFEKMLRFEDKFKSGESIAIIQLQYNYMCNMRCQHCAIERIQPKSHKRRLTPGDVAVLAKQADEIGLARFVITGGEPLVFPDLDELVAAIDPQKFYINCDSNGWLLEEKAEHLKA